MLEQAKNHAANVAITPKKIAPARFWKPCLGHPCGHDEDHIPFMTAPLLLQPRSVVASFRRSSARSSFPASAFAISSCIRSRVIASPLARS